MSDSPGALDVLRHRNFRGYYLAAFANTAGSMMTPVALAFAVLHVSNRASALGQVMAANVICLVIGGIVADRVDRRALLQVCRTSMAAVCAITAVLLFTGRATVGMLTILALFTGAAGAFAMPATMGVIQQIARRALFSKQIH